MKANNNYLSRFSGALTIIATVSTIILFFIGASERVLIINVFFSMAMLIMNLSILIRNLTELILKFFELKNIVHINQEFDNLISSTENNPKAEKTDNE